MPANDPLYKALDETGQRIVEKMVDTLFENRSVVTGKLARSIEANVTENGGGYTLAISMENYGTYVDQGNERGPGGIPPVKAIVDWLKRKGISTPSGFKTPEQFAYVIARSIASKGQKFKEPKPFIAPSVDFVVNSFLPEELDKEMFKYIDEELDKV